MRKRGRPRTTRVGRSGRSLTRIGAALALGVTALLGCALGPEQEPGCKVDADCGDGFVCKAGACFRTTTGHTETDAGTD